MVSEPKSWLNCGDWFPMRGEDRDDITYQRQRYRSRERELEITPDPVTCEPEVVETRMGMQKGRRGARRRNFLTFY